MKIEMPDEFSELITNGMLAPEPNGMQCADCGSAVFLLWNHPPGFQPEKLIPSGMWGQDVTVVCIEGCGSL